LSGVGAYPKRLTKPESLVLGAVLRLGSADPIVLTRSTGLSIGVVEESLKSLGLERLDKLSPEELSELAMVWLERGGQFEEIARGVSWSIYEMIVSRMLDAAGLGVVRSLTISVAGRRAQLDIVALNGPALYVIECKRWMRSLTGSLATAEAARLKGRATLLAEALKYHLSPGRYTLYIAPILVAPYATSSVGDSFILPLRLLLRLLSEHPSTLPSPPTFKIDLSTRLTIQDISGLRGVKVRRAQKA